MASALPSITIKEEAKCPICKEYLTGPVTVDCGHNFCRDCISRYCEIWEDLVENLECPICKAKFEKGSFRPNWQLANIAENIKCLKEDLCARHKEKLNLFCKEDQELVCLICERSPEHLSHKVLLLKDAAKECKDQLCCLLEVLRKERKRLLENKTGTEKESQHLLGQIEDTKRRTKKVFNQLKHFLKEKKTYLLSQLEELQYEITIRREEHMARLEEKRSSLDGLIQQMEEKSQQTATELLQDIRRTLERYETKEAFENPVAFPPELTCRIRGVYDVKPLLEGVIKQFPANVTLDHDTAHPNLILSKDCKSVRKGDKRQNLPSTPQRFDWLPCVLGREGFTAGKHFWEVTVGNERWWAVGVARKSVKRNGRFDLTPEEGIWAMGRRRGYRVFNLPLDTPLTLSHEPNRIRVTLNCNEGQVSFSDADTGVHIYTHSGASFSGETLLPFFYVSYKAHLRLSL